MPFRLLRFAPSSRGRVVAAASWAVGAAATAGCTAILGIEEPKEADEVPDAALAANPSNGPFDGGRSSSAGDAAGADAGDASLASMNAADAAPCEGGAQECLGTTAVQTCDYTGIWSGPWACATGACAQSACVGSTPGSTNPSCPEGDSGESACGAATESCCVSLEVPGGTYDRTYTSVADGGATGLADPASVSGFQLDKYDVTVGRFRQYVSYLTVGGGSSPVDGSGKHAYLNGGRGLANTASPGAFETGWDAADWGSNIPTGAAAVSTWNTNLVCDTAYATWTPAPAGNENRPINCLTWFEAYAFCIWDGGFLPSEAEWEFASAGGRAQLEYPWGAAPPGTGSAYAIYDCDYPDASGNCTGVENIAPVGTAQRGAATWGQLDLAGNVFEWTLDWYVAPYVDPSIDGAYLAATTTRTLRGGNFIEGTSVFVPAWRYDFDPSSRYHGHGARCARAP